MRLETILPFSDIGKDWPGLYPEYEAQRFRLVPFSDGGILDNKPFSYATQELARRPATLPVTRYLVYVEPDPKPSEAAVASREWNARDTALAALIGIPRSETIRGDLELVRRRNQAIQRARELLSLSALTATERKNLAKMVPRLEPADWLAMGFSTMVDAQPQYGPTYPVYHRLKVSVVCDSLARLLARTLGVDEEGAEMPKLRAIVDVWKRDRYAEEPSPPASGSEFPLTETQFLFRFDMPFRMRRLAFLLTTLSEAAPAFDRPSGRIAGLRRPISRSGDAGHPARGPLFRADLQGVRPVAVPDDPPQAGAEARANPSGGVGIRLWRRRQRARGLCWVLAQEDRSGQRAARDPDGARRRLRAARRIECRSACA